MRRRVYTISVWLYLLFISAAVLSAAGEIRVLATFGSHVDIDFYSPAARSTSLKHLDKRVGGGRGVRDKLN